MASIKKRYHTKKLKFMIVATLIARRTLIVNTTLKPWTRKKYITMVSE
jgi:hypothetical protein